MEKINLNNIEPKNTKLKNLISTRSKTKKLVFCDYIENGKYHNELYKGCGLLYGEKVTACALRLLVPNDATVDYSQRCNINSENVRKLCTTEVELLDNIIRYETDKSQTICIKYDTIEDAVSDWKTFIGTKIHEY